MTDPYVANAVNAFREVERVKVLLERKERALSEAVLIMANNVDHEHHDEDVTEYVRLTEQIIAEYDEKRAKAGLL